MVQFQSMSRNNQMFLRASLAAALLATVVLFGARSVQAQSIPLANCEEGLQVNGATYRICMPQTWNGHLVVYAHGYVAPNPPVGLPEDQLTLPGIGGIDAVITN